MSEAMHVLNVNCNDFTKNSSDRRMSLECLPFYVGSIAGAIHKQSHSAGDGYELVLTAQPSEHKTHCDVADLHESLEAAIYSL